MQRTALITLIFAGLGLLVGWLAYLNFWSSPEPASTSATAPAPAPGTAAPPARAVPQERDTPQTIVLYFQGADVGLLFPEERQVSSSDDPNATAHAVLGELIKGPTRDLLPTMPAGTKVKEVYFDSSGVTYLDLSSEIRDNHIGGSAEELMTVDSIVNSLARNIAQVQAVRFLVEGRPVATLAGHVDLSAPLRPTSDRLAP